MTINRTDALNQLFQVRFQLDQLQKQTEGLTDEEYDALNDALNYYGGIVSFLVTRDMESYPAEFPQTLDEQIAISREILQNAWAFHADEAVSS